jgi:hypothetical protein
LGYARPKKCAWHVDISYIVRKLHLYTAFGRLVCCNATYCFYWEFEIYIRVFHRFGMDVAIPFLSLSMNGLFMKKLIHILVAAVVGFTAAASASATSSQTNASAVVAQASAGAGKDMAGMDALVQSLQTGMVKTGFSPASRSRESSVGSFATGSAPVEASASEEAGDDDDGRMLVAGLVLMGVIALRRIRS